MAPRKQKEDDKSQPLAAAAVGAGTEPVQAQAEQKKDGVVLVDPDAESARLEAEQQAAEEARLAAEAQAAEAARLAAEQQAAEEARLAAEAQAAEAARLAAEQQAAEEARLAAEAQAAEAARLEADQQAAANQVNADWLLGQFDVKAKSPAGFWRCQVHFLHSSPTRVFVVEDKAAVPHDHDCEIPCCYLTPEEAKRVYGDPWLKVLIDSEVIKD
ncbi:MAG: hypothetical protein ACRCXB_18330 [Aeromonadaceae bacterium]